MPRVQGSASLIALLLLIACGGGSNASAPAPTTTVAFNLNLSPSSPVGPSSSVTREATVTDPLGRPRILTFTFTKSATNAWTYAITGSGTATPGGAALGTLVFSASGALTGVNGGGAVPASNPEFTVNWGDGGAEQKLTWWVVSPDATAHLTQRVSSTPPSQTVQVLAQLSASAALGAHQTISATVTDSQGGSESLTVTFTKTGVNTWSYAFGGAAGCLVSQSSVGTLDFTAVGLPLSINGAPATFSSNPVVGFNWNNGTAPASLVWLVVNQDGTANVTQP